MDAPEALTENMLVFLMKVSKDPKGILANPKKSSEIVQEFTRLMEDRSLPDFTTSLAAWLTERLLRLPTDNLIKRLKEYAFIVSLKSGILCVVEAIANRRYERLEAFNKTGDALIKRALREAADEEFDEDLINDYEWSSSSEEEPEQQQAGPDEYRPSLRPPLLDTEPHPDKAPQPEPETGGAEAENEPPPPEPEEDSHHEPPPPEPEEDSHHEPFQVETESGPNFQAHGSSDVSDEEEQQSEPSHVAAKRRRLPRLPRLPKSPRPPPAQEEALVLQVPQIIITPATFIEEPASQADPHEEEAPPANDGEGQDESHAWPSSAMDNDDGFSLPPLEEEPAPIPRRRRRRRRRGRPTIDPITQLSDREIRDNIANANMLSHPPGHLRALLLMQGQVGFQSARELLETPSIDRRQPMRDWIMRRFNDTRDERSRENGSTASGQIQPEVGPSSNTGSIPIEPSQNGSGAGGTDAPSAGQDGPIPGENDSPPVAPAAPESPSAEDVPDVWIPDDGDNADVELAEPGPEIPPNETSMTIDVTSFLEPMPPVHEEGSEEEQPTLPGIPGPSSSIPGLDDNPAVASGAPGVPSVEEIADVSIPDDGDYPSEPRPEIPPNEPSMTPVVTSFLTPMPPVHEEGSQEEQPTLPGIPGPSSSTTSVGPPDPFDVDEIPAVEPSHSPPHPPPVSTGTTSRPPPVSPERLQEAQRRTAATMAELIARHATHVHKQKKVRLRYACLSEVLESVEVNCVSTAISSLFDMSDRGEVFLIQPTSNTEQIFIFPTRQAEDEQ